MKTILNATAAALLALSLAACSPSNMPPGDATGGVVLRNLLAGSGIPGSKILSFKKVDGRELKNDKIDAYELMYDAEVQFTEGFDAKCADEKQRGKCAFLGINDDRAFAKNEILRSEGTLHFVKSEKGWVAEDSKAY